MAKAITQNGGDIKLRMATVLGSVVVLLLLFAGWRFAMTKSASHKGPKEEMVFVEQVVSEESSSARSEAPSSLPTPTEISQSVFMPKPGNVLGAVTSATPTATPTGQQTTKGKLPTSQNKQKEEGSQSDQNSSSNVGSALEGNNNASPSGTNTAPQTQNDSETSPDNNTEPSGDSGQTEGIETKDVEIDVPPTDGSGHQDQNGKDKSSTEPGSPGSTEEQGTESVNLDISIHCDPSPGGCS